MQPIATILPFVHMGLSALLIATILLQQTGTGLGEAFGGGGNEVGFHTRRGAERLLFRSALVFAFLFVVSIITALFIQ